MFKTRLLTCPYMQCIQYHTASSYNGIEMGAWYKLSTFITLSRGVFLSLAQPKQQKLKKKQAIMRYRKIIEGVLVELCALGLYVTWTTTVRLQMNGNWESKRLISVEDVSQQGWCFILPGVYLFRLFFIRSLRWIALKVPLQCCIFGSSYCLWVHLRTTQK